MVKLTADDIFDGRKFLGADRALILEDDGTVSAVVPRSWAGEDIIRVEGILAPGFINTHCHLELSHMKGVIPEHTGLPLFLQHVMEQRQPPAPELMQEFMQKAADQMQTEGIVAVGDICNTPVTLGIKAASGIYWHSFIESMGFIDSTAHQRFEQSLAVMARFKQAQLSCTVVPHAPYSVSATLFRLINELDQEGTISIHNQESPAEDALYVSKTGAMLDFFQHFHMDISGFSPSGKSSLQSYLPYFAKAPRMLLVHNTCTTAEDIRFAKQQGLEISWCFCPNANLYIENRLPDILSFVEEDVNITLGTDSLASNHQLSVWSEITTLRIHYPQLPFETILKWATLNGAQALGIDERFGSFEKGKRPGIVQISGNAVKAYKL